MEPDVIVPSDPPGPDLGRAVERLVLTLPPKERACVLLKDVFDGAATPFPTPNGGCHPLWVLGHLTFIEGTIPEVLYGDRNPVAGWAHLFDKGSEPVGDAGAYPRFAEVREKYLQLRERNLQILESLSEADLDKPTKAPPKGLEHEFATYGLSFLTLALHQTMHRSHVTDALRAVRVGAHV